MARLAATFDVRLPARFVLKRPEQKSFLYCFQLPDAEVELVLLSDLPGAKAKHKGDEQWTFTVSSVQVTVSRHEEIEPPIIRLTESGDRDLSDRAAYFGERLPRYRVIAAEAVNRAISFFQFRLRNPGLRQITVLDQDLQNPRWTDEAGEEINPGIISVVSELKYGLNSQHFGVQKLTADRDTELQETLENPVRPELWEELVSDAQQAAFVGNFRRAILELAIACEVLLKRVFLGATETTDAAFEYLEEKGLLRMPVIDLLDGVARRAFGTSFRDVSAEDYQSIDFLFRCRNKVAHRGLLAYRDDRGVSHEVDRETLLQWWKSVDKMISWVRSSAVAEPRGPSLGE